MSEWMWFVVILTGIIYGTSCFHKWMDTQIKLERMQNEELGTNDPQDDSDDC